MESEKEIELVDWIGEAGGEVVSIEHKGSIGNVFSRIFFPSPILVRRSRRYGIWH